MAVRDYGASFTITPVSGPWPYLPERSIDGVREWLLEAGFEIDGSFTRVSLMITRQGWGATAFLWRIAATSLDEGRAKASHALVSGFEAAGLGQVHIVAVENESFA